LRDLFWHFLKTIVERTFLELFQQNDANGLDLEKIMHEAGLHMIKLHGTGNTWKELNRWNREQHNFEKLHTLKIQNIIEGWKLTCSSLSWQ
jgi:hypothetical protein